MFGGPGSDTVSYDGSDAGVMVDISDSTTETGGHAQGDSIDNTIENITGSAHADTLTGDGNANILTGGAGADTLDGGDGNDTASYEGSNAAVTVNLQTNSISGGHAQGDTYTSIENIIGSAHADTLTGDGNANVLTGGAGADAMDGGTGSDTVSYAGSSTGLTVDLATPGNNTTGSEADGDTYTSIENITGSPHDDTLGGDANANVLKGGNGNDTLWGNAGNDTLYGGAGNNTYNPGTGTDEFFYAGNNSTINGYAAGENIWICVGDTSSAITIAQADSGSNRVITITRPDGTTRTITLTGSAGTAAAVAWSDPNAAAGTGCNF